MPECDGKRRDGVGVVDEAVEFRPLGTRLLHCVAHDDEAGGQNLHVPARAAKLFHSALHVGIELSAGGEVALRREHGFRRLSRKLPAGLRRPGLHDHRPALDRARDIERSSHRKIFTLVIEHMHLRWVEENAVLDIADERVVGPAVPETRHHVIKLPCAPIALAVLDMLLEAKIERGVRIGSGDDIPAGTAAGNMIEGGETPRDVIGRIESRRAGGDQTDALGDLGQGRQQRERLERRHRVAALKRVERHVEHGHMVGHEKGIELRPLQRLDRVFQVRKVEIHVRPRAGIAPRAGVDARRPHECAEMELA